MKKLTIALAALSFALTSSLFADCGACEKSKTCDKSKNCDPATQNCDIAKDCPKANCDLNGGKNANSERKKMKSKRGDKNAAKCPKSDSSCPAQSADMD